MVLPPLPTGGERSVLTKISEIFVPFTFHRTQKAVLNENIGIFSVLCYPMEVKVLFGRKFLKSFCPLLPTGQAGSDFRSLSLNFLSSYLAGHQELLLTVVSEIFLSLTTHWKNRCRSYKIIWNFANEPRERVTGYERAQKNKPSDKIHRTAIALFTFS